MFVGLCILSHKTQLRLVVLPDVSQHLPKIAQSHETLGSAALEVLAVIAYNQPVTQDIVEQLRGVGSEQSLKTLLEKDLITKKIIKKSGIKQIQYTTTLKFLQSAGIKSLEQLPKLSE